MFQALVSAKQADPTPLRSSISEQFKWIAVAFGATLTYGVGFYTVMSYMPTYLKEVTDFGAGEMFVVTCAVLLAHITALPLLGVAVGPNRSKAGSHRRKPCAGRRDLPGLPV